MVKAGLTGGIGSGKSNVALMFKDEGAYIIDFDELARIVVEPDKPAWRKIVGYFGNTILSPDRTLDRAALAKIVFSDNTSRKALEDFIHPMILMESDALIKDIIETNPSSIVIIDFPLLFELGMNEGFDKIILAYACRDIQLKRVMKRDDVSKEDVDERLKAQMPIEEKRVMSDYVIDTQGSFNDTRKQVKKVMSELRKFEKQL